MKIRAMLTSKRLNKRLLMLAATLCFAVLGGNATRAVNVLYNYDLDLVQPANAVTPVYQSNPCPLGWNIDCNTYLVGSGATPFHDGGDSETWCSVDLDQPTPDGNDYGFFFKPFQGNLTEENLVTCFLYQDNPTTPGTAFTLSGYPSAQPLFCGYPTNYLSAYPQTNGPIPQALFLIEFLDNTGNIIQSNAFDLVAAGMPNTGPFNSISAAWLYTTPSVTAPAGTATVRAGAEMLYNYGTSGSQSWFVDYFDLEATPPPGAPVITNQPAAATAAIGGNATFTVGVSNSAGATYQWQFDSQNITDGALTNGVTYSGTTTSTLQVSGASNAAVGHYRVVVSNSAGSVYSANAPLALTGLAVNPVISIYGNLGDTYLVEYSTSLSPANWIPLSTNKLTAIPTPVIDTTSTAQGARYYQAVFVK